MAETTLLRTSGLTRNVSPHATSARPSAQLSGALPIVQVNMNAGGPQIQGRGQQVRQGVAILPPRAATRNFAVGGPPNQGAKQSVEVSSLKDPTAPLKEDQLLLCRHLLDKYVSEHRSADGTEAAGVTGENLKLAGETIAAIDAAVAAMTAVTARAAALAAARAAAQSARAAVQSRVSSGAPTGAPRRVARPAPVAVKMDDGRPVLQTDVETLQAVVLDPDLPGVVDAIEIGPQD